MAVAFDAVGPAGGGGQFGTAVTSITWTHTDAGSACAVFVGIGDSVQTATATVTVGGASATAVAAKVQNGGSTFGFTQGFGVANVATGAQTVLVSSGTADLIGGSVSYTGAGTTFATAFGAGVTASGNSTAPAVTVTGTTSGNMVTGVASIGTNVLSNPATSRWLDNASNGSGIGNAGGADKVASGSVTFTWSGTTADVWGAVAVEVLAAGGPAPAPLPYVPQLPPCWFPGSDLAVTRPGVPPFYVPPGPSAVFVQPAPVLPDTGYVAPQPPGWFPGAPQTGPYATPFYVQPLPVAEPGAVPLPPLPPPPPTPLPPIGPYWFPGADALASCPGDIPFWIQPQPDSSPSLPPAAGLPVITGLSGPTSAAWFKDQFGNPRWMFSDTVWTIVYSAGRSGAQTWQQDMDQVVSTRASQGYTAIECNLLPNNEYIASGLTTWDGIHPFVTGTDPSSGLNDPYWQRVDYLLTSLAIHGMTLFMNLIMGADVSAGTAGSWTATQATDYGNKVATRFLTVKNIVWMLGDDGGVGATTLSNILTGIRNSGDTRFVACENPQETTSRYGLQLNDVQTFGLANAQYNWVYTYAPSYGGVEYAYGEASPIPVIRGDGYYFGTIGGTDDKVARESFWWCITSGSRGYSWGMSDGGWGAFAAGWTSNLTFAGEEAGTAGDFQNNVFPAVTNYLTTLANFQKLAPDISNVFITAGRGTRAPYQVEGIQNQYTGTPADTYVSGSVATDGTLALIYFSRGAVTTITINQALLGAGYTATWVDPANVATSPGTPGPTFTKPAGANSAGDHDWLLVLQGPAVIPIAAPGIQPQPPYWFPGADKVTAIPGGIPFAQPYVPDPGVTATVTITGTASAAGAGAVTAVVTQIAPATAAGAGSVTDVVTQIAPATAAGAGSVAALAVEQAPATAAGAGAVTDVVTQIVIATAVAAGSVTDVVTQIATGAAAGASAVADVVTQIAPATAAGAAAVTDVVTQIVIATAAGAGTVNATPAGLLTDPAPQWQPLPPGWFPGAQAVTADPGGIPFYAEPQPALTAPAAAVITGTASAAGAGSVTAVVTQDAGALTTAAGAAAVTDVVTQAATATAAGAGSAAAVVTQQAPGTAAAAGTVNASGAIAGAAGITGQAAATAKAVQGVIASPAGAASLSALAVQQATAALAGAGAVNATGLSTATVVKGYSTATSVTEQAGMAATVTEQAGMAAAVGERASSAASVS